MGSHSGDNGSLRAEPFPAHGRPGILPERNKGDILNFAIRAEAETSPGRCIDSVE